MRRRLALTLAVATFGACGGAPAPPSAPTTLTVDSLNVALVGAFIPFETQRRPAVLAALTNSPADVVCLQEVWREEDKELIQNTVRARFPHVARFRHDNNTRVDTAIDPMCAVPPEPTVAPCAPPTVRPLFEAGIRCLAQNCSTMPGSEMGQATSTACARERCIGDVSMLLLGEADARRCYGCLAPNLTSETFAGIRELCTTNVNGDLAFRGQNGVMILSRYPLSNVETRVVPGTWNRRAIVRARATLPDRSTVDVYCNHLTPVFEDPAFPYTGRHGCGMFNREGWATEQLAQARALVSYVAQASGNGRAVVLGDLNTGPDISSARISGEAPETYEYLRMQLTPALPTNHAPQCTYCAENPLVGGTDSVWIDHILLRGFPAGAVRSFARTYTERSVAVSMAPGMIPISDHYGVRAVLSLSP